MDCDNYKKDFDAEEQTRPIYGATLHDVSPDEMETTEMVSTMTILEVL